MFLSLSPYLISFHWAFGSIDLNSDLLLATTWSLLLLFREPPNSLNTSYFLSEANSGSRSNLCDSLWTFLYGTIMFGTVGGLPLILLWSHYTVLSVTPSLPHRCKHFKLWALVSNCPNYLIAGVISPVFCKSRCIKFGLYFTKSLKLSITSMFHSDSSTSSTPCYRSS